MGSDFSPVAVARGVLRSAMTAALATLGGDGPFASLVSLATAPSGEPILLLSRLAVHSGNLDRSPRGSLLLSSTAGDGDPMSRPRLTLMGGVSGVDPDPMLRRRFLARHPEATAYAGFADFGFRRFTIASAHLVAGFGRIVDLAAEEVLVDCAGCEALLAADAGAVAHMNNDHADALRLYATRLLGLPDGGWRATGIDPDGLDLCADGRGARLDFPERVTTPQALRATLAALAAKARAD